MGMNRAITLTCVAVMAAVAIISSQPVDIQRSIGVRVHRVLDSVYEASELGRVLHMAERSANGR